MDGVAVEKRCELAVWERVQEVTEWNKEVIKCEGSGVACGLKVKRAENMSFPQRLRPL